jgi:hypothetical protein
MGKMDTSDLSERYFDENTILYNIGNRNEIVFGEKTAEKEEKKEETITFTPGPGVTAIVHGENGEADQVVHGEAPEGAATNESVDSDEETLLTLWRMYKEGNPEGTLADFYKEVSTTNSEVK